MPVVPPSFVDCVPACGTVVQGAGTTQWTVQVQAPGPIGGFTTWLEMRLLAVDPASPVQGTSYVWDGSWLRFNAYGGVVTWAGDILTIPIQDRVWRMQARYRNPVPSDIVECALSTGRAPSVEVYSLANMRYKAYDVEGQDLDPSWSVPSQPAVLD